MAKQAPKKKGASGYKLPDPLPKGEIVVDIAKKSWKLGESIGQGGFGEIYSAQEGATKSTNYPYVIKIEPHENGPLFVEINFYIRNAKPQEVKDFMSKKKLKMLGMPTYVGSGSHEYKNERYRFLVMHKFGTDIWKLFLENGRTFPVTTVFKLGVQILDVLEYIHEHGYVHGDIKGANVLLGLSKEAKNQVYLVDFGLVTKFQTGGEFKANPKKAHDGTIEYLSRDAHHGVPTRRGDLEILAYNMIQWLGCTLPWENDLSRPVNVQKSKEEYMSDTPKFLKNCFGSKSVPASIVNFLKYINSLSFDAKPDYAKIRKLFISEIELNGEKLTSPMIFASEKQISPKRKLESNKTNPKKLKKAEPDQNGKEEDVSEEINVKSKTKQVQSKTNKLVPDHEFEGFTDEMKAVSLKKLQNGVTKRAPRKNTESKKGEPKPNIPETEEKYAGFTSEMKAIATKKVKNGMKETINRPKENPETKSKENGTQNVERPRRNVKVVNYADGGNPSK